MSDRITVSETGTSALGVVETGHSRSLALTFVPIAIAGALLALVPLWVGDSRVLMGLAVDGLLFAGYAIAFNVIFGSTGQLFLCVGALAGVGGYTAALLADRAGVPLVMGVILGSIASCLLGGLFSWVAVRRSLDVIFTGIVTLAFSLSFQNLLLGQRELTGGETGLVIEAGSGTFLRELIPPYYFFLGLVLVFLAVHGLLRRSHIGWAFRALRDDEVAAELSGINAARYRIYAGMIGSAMLGMAGAVYAYTEGFISPSTFAFARVDVRVLVMLAFGGIGTLLGPVLGAVVFTILDEVLIGFVQLREVIYGVLVVALFLGFKGGAIPFLSRLFTRSRKQARPSAESVE
ncbi:MAG: branched-chain amino acid ABC transporter permease [Actinomycetota bacterium]|nr:branched-chain amino acid ABC transporter permease [Actinomycetota bacterium]